ncbi:hypothetical protein [Haloferula helveola]
MRRKFTVGLVIALLVATQLPLICAAALSVANPGSDHQLLVVIADRQVELTLHHVGDSVACRHRHTAIEHLLVHGDPDAHPDHHLSFGAGPLTLKPCADETGSEAPEELPATTDDPSLHFREEFEALPTAWTAGADRSPPHPDPRVRRKGTVMRN